MVWNRPRVIRSQGFLFASPQWRNSQQRILNAIGRPSSTWLFALPWKAHPIWRYETGLAEIDPKGVYSLRPDGESRNNALWTQLHDLRQPPFSCCLEKPTQNGRMKPTWWHSIPRVFIHFAQWGKSKQRVLNAIGRPSSTRLFALLGKATQKGGMKPTSCNSIPRIFIRFAPMAKLAATHFERNWSTIVNLAFCTALKSPPNMALWNRPRGNRSQGCLFASPRWAKSKQRVVNAIGRPSSTRLFALLGKANPKRWYETDLEEFDPKGVYSLHPDGESRNNALWTQLDDLPQPGFLGCWKSPPKMVVWNRPRGIRSQGCLFASPRWGKSKQRVLNAIGRPSSTRLFVMGGKAHPKWWYETNILEFDSKSFYSLRPDGESRNNAFWSPLDDLRQPGFSCCLEKPTQNGGMKPTSLHSIPRVFILFALMGKVETTRFERNWTTFVNTAFYAAWKSQPKMVVWNQPRGIRFQGCLFASPRWGK